MSSPQIISCSKQIVLHSLDVRQPINAYSHHRGMVNSVSLSHNNKAIASCGQDGKVFIVNADKIENKIIQSNFYSANTKEKASSLSTCLFSPNTKYLAVGSVDSVIKLWDLRSDKNVKTQPPLQIKSHMGAITSFAWIRNLKGESYGTDILASSSSSGDIYLHTNKNGEFIQTNYLKMPQSINCIRVSQLNNSCRLAACTNNGTLAIWDLMANKQKPFWVTPPSQNKASTTSLSFSPYSSVLLVTSSVDESLVFYDIHDKKMVKKISTEEPLSSVALHHNGQILIAGGMYGSIYAYDLRYPTKPQNKLIGHETAIKHMQFYKQRQKQLNENKINRATSSLSNNVNLVEKKNPIIQEQSKLKQIIKPPETVVNNYMNNQRPTQPIVLNSQQLQEKSKENINQPKIQKPVQQIIKSSIPKKTQVISQFKQSADPDFYRNRSKQQRQGFSNESAHDYENLKKEVKQIKDILVSLKGNYQQFKNEIYEMQDRMNISMIKQFQLHQQEMTKIIQNLLNRDQQKGRIIKRLEEENKKLKTTTF